MFKLFVIGVSDELLTATNKQLLTQCSYLFATERLQGLAAELNIAIHNISPVSKAIEEIKEKLNYGNVAVLASGDPLFYGIGKKILNEIGPTPVEFHPALSSIQRAAALCKTHWDDAIILTLHGREHGHIPGLVLPHKKSILLTDKTNSPTVISRSTLEYLKLIEEDRLVSDIRVMVAENIGLPDQRLFSGSLAEASTESFAALNVMIITTNSSKQESLPATFGLTEDEVIHSRGLITKNEVRAATIHQLRLPKKGVLWDIGAGSGSVSIEAARTHPELTIFAIEHKPEEIANIKANIRKFGCYNIVPVFGKAPESLQNLPGPDRIFVGGSSGTLPSITKLAQELLPEDGRIVINGVIAKTIEEAPEQLKINSFAVETTTINVTRTDCNNTTVTFNPITITTGSR
ncbi:precorrin-6y C5,15-methyltransferase (decarboxylating) subunit CbiE [Desulforhopalus sp. 52FAK]